MALHRKIVCICPRKNGNRHGNYMSSRIRSSSSSCHRSIYFVIGSDGINDAPALVQADIGIAIEAGTDVTIESADIILVRNDPRDVLTAIHLAKVTYKKMLQNLMWATGYNALAIPLAAGILYKYGVLLSPVVGAVLMSTSTIIVAINAKLLKA